MRKLVMHIKLTSFHVFCKIFNFKKFELKCSIQVKIDVKIYITKNHSYGLKVAIAQWKYSSYAFVVFVMLLVYQGIKKKNNSVWEYPL